MQMCLHCFHESSKNSAKHKHLAVENRGIAMTDAFLDALSS